MHISCEIDLLNMNFNHILPLKHLISPHWHEDTSKFARFVFGTSSNHRPFLETCPFIEMWSSYKVYAKLVPMNDFKFSICSSELQSLFFLQAILQMPNSAMDSFDHIFGQIVGVLFLEFTLSSLMFAGVIWMLFLELSLVLVNILSLCF